MPVLRQALRPLLPALLLLLAACGQAQSPSQSPAQDATGAVATDVPSAPATQAVEPATSAPTSAPDVPQRIVSLSPTATEMLFAIGAGDQVAAVDSQSDYPPEAPTTELSAFQPNVEAIAALEPDLVVLSYDPGDIVDGFQAVGIDTLLQDAAPDLDGTYEQLRELGERTGNLEGAADVVADMQAQIDALVADVPRRDQPLTYYHELDDTLYTVTSDTFVGEIYSLAGLSNIADPADPDGQAGGYPQLSPEFVIAADPDLVFLAGTECCGVTVDSFGARAGFDQLSAVQQGRIVPLDDAVASRWGPRIVELLRAVVDAVDAVGDVESP